MKSILGVDYGSKRIGVAVSDDLGARPLEVITRKHEAIPRLKKLAESYEVEEIVVGLPYRLGGEAGPEVTRVLAFVAELQAAVVDLRVVTQDEALTTYEAQSRMLALDMDPAERKAKVDAWAAAVMLEEYLGKIPR